MTWAEIADVALSVAFGDDPATMPSRQTLIAAYPFGERRYWPYRVWLVRRRAWLFARRLGFARPIRGPGEPRPRIIHDPAQLEMPWPS